MKILKAMEFFFGGFCSMEFFVLFMGILQICHGAGLRARGRIHASSKGCEFPERWTGTWFQKGVHPPIKIQKDIFSFKGKCLAENSHMFYIEDTKEKCFRCVVIYEKHPNVLQYRETYCDGYKSLNQACSILNADAPLYSLFRVDADPVSCDLRGPFTFTYSRGHGECAYPLSTIDSCTNDSQLLFRFQACADVMGTESSVEELTCTAVWKEGSAHYLVGKITTRKSYKQSFTDENAYRCFVFDYLTEKGHGGHMIQMSQSADATCDGLVSPFEGSRTMRLTKSKHPPSGCQFPAWASGQHKWHSLDGRSTYAFGHKNHTSFRLKHQDQPDTRFECIEQVSTTVNTSTVVAYSTSGCKTGFVCMKFFSRSKHIIEIQYGEVARSTYEACYSILTSGSTQEFVTLVAGSVPTSVCPQLESSSEVRVHVTREASTGPVTCPRDHAVKMTGCRNHDSLDFVVSCAKHTDVKSFHCHGSWEEDGRNYLVTGLRNTGYKYCFVYWNTDKTAHLSGVHDTCRRSLAQAHSDNHLTFNISSTGTCDSIFVSSRSPAVADFSLSLQLLFLLVVKCLPIR